MKVRTDRLVLPTRSLTTRTQSKISISRSNLTIDRFRLRPPTPKQREWQSRPERFIVLVTGRRCGKTIGALQHLVEKAIEKPNQNLWYVAPTFNDAYDLAWAELLEMIPRSAMGRDPNISRLTIWLQNNTRIQLMSAENMQKRRGRGLDGVILDEWTLYPLTLWEQVVLPSLADRQGWAILAATPPPDGKSSPAYKFWQNCQNDPDFFTLSYSTLEGGLVPPEEIERMRRILHPRNFRQEFEACWESPSGQILDALSTDNLISPDQIPDRFDAVVMAIDWGDFNPCITVTGKRADVWYLLDAWHNPNAEHNIPVRDDELLAQAKIMWARYSCTHCFADPSRPQSIDFFVKNRIPCQKANNAWNEGAAIVNSALYHKRLWINDRLSKAFQELASWHRATDRFGNILEIEAPNQRAETPDCLRYTLLSMSTSKRSNWWQAL